MLRKEANVGSDPERSVSRRPDRHALLYVCTPCQAKGAPREQRSKSLRTSVLGRVPPLGGGH